MSGLLWFIIILPTLPSTPHTLALNRPGRRQPAPCYTQLVPRSVAVQPRWQSLGAERRNCLAILAMFRVPVFRRTVDSYRFTKCWID